ncbi:bifunctional metallophosphatase/5'-nucleotidase [Achromobacter insolitus]|uniref:bifunctional metallophosphatase/5'-nucleotidase n=1 Tax=Achromobacter insolitus TaxID=217204 RepID=UPI0007C67BC2|nr:5'-nucleotidase C-terminal domain-containing protein [Achromobacter insolitus]OAE59587.1 bifunctional metallophosphatase/5'-nucleotidase [Achromobacter insolitus]OCZ55979.1 bifunctional metallophosphatase/5'-nucleotidase [Achromobacter insolitus]
MNTWKRNAGAAMLSALTLLAGCGGSDDDDDTPVEQPEHPAPGRPMELTILHINDHHSNLDSKKKDLKLKTASGSRVAVNADTGGFPRVTGAINALAAQSANVLKLHAGDATTGTLYFNRAGEPGEADAAMMNTVCFDAMTLGNHEFDKGDSGLKRFIDLLHTGACQTPVLSANVTFAANSALNPARAPGMVKPAVILKRDGQDIGLVGLTIAAKTQQSSSPDTGTVFSDETAAAQQQIDALRAQGVNKIVVMSHIGYDYDKQVIAQLSGVDVVVGGDSHTLLGPASMADYGVGTPAGAYPTVLQDKDGKRVCLVQAWEYSQVVGELKVSFDANGDVTACAGTPHVLMDGPLKVAGVAPSAADEAAIQADVQASGFLRMQTPDAPSMAVLQPFKAKVDQFSRSLVASVPQELCSRRVPGGPGSRDYSRSSAACNTLGSVSLRGGDIQQLVAQAYLDVANASYGGADISLQSGGGVRVPLLGNVTAANVIEVVPFGNMLWRLDVTGAEVKSMLEDGMQAVYGAGGSTGPYPYAGGLRWDVNAAQAQGNRVSNVEVRDQASGNWVPLDASRSYKLFVLSFNATGGDGYKTLANVPASRRQDIGVLDADVLQAYIDKQAKDPVSGLPVLNLLPTSLYSTKTYSE